MAQGETSEPRVKRKRIKTLLVAVTGLAVGSVAAVGILHSFGVSVPAAFANDRTSRPQAMEYVAVGKLTVPVVDREGELVRYVAIEASLEVPRGMGDEAKAKLPVVLHQINMVTWKSALSTGADGELVDTNSVEKIFETAAKQVYGKDVTVNRVLLTSTVPA